MKHSVPDTIVRECRAALAQFRAWRCTVSDRMLVIAPWKAIAGEDSAKLMVAHEGAGCAFIEPASGFSALDLIRGGLSITVAMMVTRLLEQVGTQVDLRLLESISTTPQRTRRATTFPAPARKRPGQAKMRASARRSHSSKTNRVLDVAA